MKYGKQKKKIYCKFSRFRTFYTLKTSLERTIFSVCHAASPCRGFLDEIWGAASSAVLSARKLKFWLQASFEPTWCTSYSEFWNFEIPLKTQESTNFEISVENSQKLLDGSKSGKSKLYSDLENSKFSLKKS
jgi:hypothetical protein